jgi:hypothetical protein
MVNSGFRMEQATDAADRDPFEPERLLDEVGAVSCLGRGIRRSCAFNIVCAAL